MTRSPLFIVGAIVAAANVTLAAQDPVKADPAHYKVLVDNASVRVLQITYAPGGRSVAHQHPDSIVVPLAASKVEFTLADGKAQTESLAKDSAMYSAAGTHTPKNVGTTPVQAILVEFKGRAPGKAVLPAARPGMQSKTLAEGPYGTAFLNTLAADFAEAPGTKHDYDQVVITLGSGSVAVSVDGKPAKTTWERGDVLFIGRGVAHESKNTGGKPLDMILVAVK